MKKYFLFFKVLFVIGMALLAACGKQGPLEYPEENDFPRTYPVPE